MQVCLMLAVFDLQFLVFACCRQQTAVTVYMLWFRSCSFLYVLSLCCLPRLVSSLLAFGASLSAASSWELVTCSIPSCVKLVGDSTSEVGLAHYPGVRNRTVRILISQWPAPQEDHSKWNSPDSLDCPKKRSSELSFLDTRKEYPGLSC